MKLLILLAVFFIDKHLRVDSKWRNFTWYTRGLDVVRESIASRVPINSDLIYISFIILFAAIICLLNFAFSGVLFGLLELLMSLIILWYCLGPVSITSDMTDFAMLENNSDNLIESVRKFTKNDDISQSNVYRMITKGLFWQAHERFFALVIWYLIFGIFGLLVYRQLQLCIDYLNQQEEQDNWVIKIHAILAWLPARLTSLIYCLVGNYVPAFKIWQEIVLTKSNSKSILIKCGLSALDISEEQGSKEENLTGMELIHRTQIFIIMTTALWVIAATFI